LANSYLVEPDLRRWVWALGLGLVALIGGVLWATGVSAFPLILVALVAGGLGLAQFSSLRLGFLGALAVLLGGYAVLLRFTMVIPWGLAAIGGLALLLMALAGMAVLLRGSGQTGAFAPLALPTRRVAVGGAVLLGLALLVTIVAIPAANSRGYGPVWAMHNDAVIQMLKARVQLAADGFDTTHALNSSPLTSALVALAAAVGRIRVASPDQFLQNDALRLAETWGLLTLASSALAGWLVPALGQRQQRGLRSEGPEPEELQPIEQPGLEQPQLDLPDLQSGTPHRSANPLLIGGALIAAAMPLTWYFSGFSFAFGFMNSTLSLVILLLAWAIWLELPERGSVLGAGLLSLTTVAMLATWAPLALLPAGLTLIALWRALPSRQLSPTPKYQWWLWLLAALPVPLYGLLVTVPDFGRQGEGLAVQGGIPPLPLSHLILAAVLAAVGLAAYGLVTRDFRLALGLIAVLLAGAAVLTVLIQLNLRAGLPGWGYYPYKGAWAIAGLLLIIGATALFAALVRLSWPAWTRWVGAAAVSVVAVLLMRQYLFQPLNVRNFFAPVEIARSRGFADGPWRANILFDSYRDDELTILAIEDARWMVQDQIVPGDGRADQFANFWLLQIHPGAGLPGGPQEVMGRFAYTLDPRVPQHFCDAVATWGKPTTVITTNADFGSQVLGLCPELPITIEVSEPRWAGNPFAQVG